MGAFLSGRLHRLCYTSILRGQILYLHDKLGLRPGNHDHANFRRTGHTMALRSSGRAESGARVGAEGSHDVGTENLLVAL